MGVPLLEDKPLMGVASLLRGELVRMGDSVLLGVPIDREGETVLIALRDSKLFLHKLAVKCREIEEKLAASLNTHCIQTPEFLLPSEVLMLY